MIRILDRMVGQAFIRLFVRFIIGAPMLFILADITDNLAYKFVMLIVMIPAWLILIFFFEPRFQAETWECD